MSIALPTLPDDIDALKVIKLTMNLIDCRNFDLVILGGGPAGASGAPAGGLLGRRVALVEKAARVSWVRDDTAGGAQ